VIDSCWQHPPVNCPVTCEFTEYAKKAGITANIPDATLKVIHDTTEEFVKAASIQNQVTLATMDATQQNIKTFNDNAKLFADLNKNILQSWISVFTTKNN